MLSNITFLMIIAVFDQSALTLWINCSFLYLYLLFYCQVCVMCYCVITEYIKTVFSILSIAAVRYTDCRKLKLQLYVGFWGL